MTNESSKGQNTSAEETLRQRSFIELAQALTAKKSRQTVLFYKKTAAAYCAERAGKRAKAHMQY